MVKNKTHHETFIPQNRNTSTKSLSLYLIRELKTTTFNKIISINSADFGPQNSNNIRIVNFARDVKGSSKPDEDTTWKFQNMIDKFIRKRKKIKGRTWPYGTSIKFHVVFILQASSAGVRIWITFTIATREVPVIRVIFAIGIHFQILIRGFASIFN